MVTISAQSPSDWYSLAKEIISDFRGATFQDRLHRRERLKELFLLLRLIHCDYVSLLRNLIDDCHFSKAEHEVTKAKQDFLTRRKVHSPDRSLLKFDAEALINSTSEIDEKRFLGAILWYFQYQDCRNRELNTISHLDVQVWLAAKDSGDKAWDSATSRLWIEISDVDDPIEIKKLTLGTLTCVSNNYSLIVETFTEIESNWQFGTASQISRMSRMLNEENTE